jgi:DNA adenine methylase
MPVPAKVIETAKPLPPPLKWAGGKRWQLPHLEPLWTPHADRRLIEPFCGGLAVAIGLMPARALLNDINPHVVAFYRALKRGLRVSVELANDEALYYAHRERFNELLRDGKEESDEAAGLFYFLNRTGYNGLCRFNRSGEFNVPFGSYKKITYTRDFVAYKEAFAEWDFTATDFARIELSPDDFVYADPPYDVEFTQYAPGGFSWDDQVRTADWLSRHRGPVILVNQATRRIVDLYDRLGYELHYLQAPRRISCNGDRTPAREVMATRNLSTHERAVPASVPNASRLPPHPIRRPL